MSRVSAVVGARDWAAAFVGVLILVDAFDTSLRALFGADSKPLPGLPIARIPLLFVFLAAALLLWGHRNRALSVARAAWPLWPALALAFASTLWSVAPAQTLTWSLSLLGVSAFGVALATRFSAVTQAVLIAAVVTSIALASVLLRWQWPVLAADAHGVVFEHKNLLGRVMGLGFAAAVTVVASGRQRAASAAAAVACAAVLWASSSRAAQLSAGLSAAVLAVVLAAQRQRRRAVAIVAGGVLAIGVVLVVLLATEQGVRLLRRSYDFTSRTRIWIAVADAAGQRPWLGYGYGAFWQSAEAQRLPKQIGIEFGWHPHNGFLELYADLGIFGLATVLVPLAGYAAIAMRHALDGTRACVWPIVYLVFFVASNAAETSLLRHKIYWALYVAVACHLAAARQCSGLEGRASARPRIT